MKKYYSYLKFTEKVIKERNLSYSPELFSQIMQEVKKTPKFVKLVNETNKWIEDNQPKGSSYKYSFMSNHLTTDKRLK